MRYANKIHNRDATEDYMWIFNILYNWNHSYLNIEADKFGEKKNGISYLCLLVFL